MNPKNALEQFQDFNIDNFKLISELSGNQIKIGWDCNKRKFYHIGEAFVNGGVSKGSYLGYITQTVALHGARLLSTVENDSTQVILRLVDQYTKLDRKLKKLELYLDAMGLPIDSEIENSLRATYCKLDELAKILTATPAGIISWRSSFELSDDKLDRAELLGDEIEKLPERFSQITALNGKIENLLPIEQTLLKSFVLDSDFNTTQEESHRISPDTNLCACVSDMYSTGLLMLRGSFGSAIDLSVSSVSELGEVGQLRQILQNPSRMLVGRIVQCYLNMINFKLAEDNDRTMTIIDTFYFGDGACINNFSVDSAMISIQAKLTNHISENPICIPIVFKGYGRFTRNHITCILIKDNIVEFFDGKIIKSTDRKLGEKNETLHDLLQELHLKLTQSGLIIENERKLQHENINCGVLLCEFIDRRMCKKQPMGWQPMSISLVELDLMRKEIFGVVKIEMLKEYRLLGIENMEYDSTLDEDIEQILESLEINDLLDSFEDVEGDFEKMKLNEVENSDPH